MLSPEYLQEISEGAEVIAAQLHTDILKRIIGRIQARQRRGDEYILTSTDKWNLETLQEAGYLREDLEQEIAKYTGYQQEEIKQAFEDAGVRTLRYEDTVYEQSGLSPTPLQQSPHMVRLMQRNYEATMHEWDNFTRTTAESSQTAFISLCNTAYNNVMSGGMGYIQAFNEAIDQLINVGVFVEYPSGHKDTIETATLRAVRTGVSQACAEITVARAEEMGQDLVLVSSHMGARPSHQVWQGQVFSLFGRTKGYEKLSEATGYGTGPGLCGWNCRHSFGAYDPETGFNPFDRYDDERNKILYARTQRQRNIESSIRRTKRDIELNEYRLKDDIPPETRQGIENKLEQLRPLLKKKQAAYTEFCDKYDLRPLPERLRIAQRRKYQPSSVDVPYNPPKLYE